MSQSAVTDYGELVIWFYLLMLLQMFLYSLFDQFHYTFIVPYVSKKFFFEVQMVAIVFAFLSCASFVLIALNVYAFKL